MNKAVVAGGTGFIGRAVVSELGRKGYEVVVLSRSKSDVANARVRIWDGETVGNWAEELDGAQIVVCTCGSSAAVRWTAENRRRIIESRLPPVQALGKAIARCSESPRSWVTAAAAGYYGDTLDNLVNESSPPGEGFLAEVCKAWEAEIETTQTPKTHKSWIRVGLVLGEGGGVLPIFSNLTRWFLGGTVGSGRQYLPWIHLDDLAKLFVWCGEECLEGPVNGSAPEPATNRELMAALRRVLKRPWCPPAPAPLVRLGCAVMGVDPSMALKGCRMVPKRALEGGFSFEFEELEPALRNVLGRELGDSAS
jgi:uncharacterized protein (TIGR01777 family)